MARRMYKRDREPPRIGKAKLYMPSKAEEIQEKSFEFFSETFYSSLFRTVFFSQNSNLQTMAP